MVNILSNEYDLLFHALSDPTRRQILKRLGEGAKTIGELALPFKISLPAISKHIKILERAHLVNLKRSGRICECTLNPVALKTAEECLQFYTKFWNEKLDAFARELEKETQPSERKK